MLFVTGNYKITISKASNNDSMTNENNNKTPFVSLNVLFISLLRKDQQLVNRKSYEYSPICVEPLSVFSRLLELQQQHERETGEMARYAPSCFASWMAIDPIPAAP